MALNRLNQVIGFLGKVEATYGTAESLSNSADGFNPYIGDGDPEPPTPYTHVFDGSIGRAFGTLAPQIRTTPNGRTMQGQMRVLPKGYGSAYSSSAVMPPNEVHRWLQACGFDATFDTDHWEYTPTAHGTGFKSLTLNQYAQQSLYPLVGVLGNLSFETQGLGVPVWTIDYRGLSVAPPTDVALPAITVVAPSVIPPVGSDITCDIGSYTSATVRRVAFRSNRNIDTARPDLLLAGGHAGFVPGAMAPELELEIERPARATFDPEDLLFGADALALALQFGSATGNTWSLDAPQAQVKAVTPGADAALATITLVFSLHASTPSANDFVSFTFA